MPSPAAARISLAAQSQSGLQKAVGHSLTGIASEQALFFVYGKSGNSGKSTAVNLFRNMLGDYGWPTRMDTLLVKQYDNNIPADLARLAGVRMVTAIEPTLIATSTRPKSRRYYGPVHAPELVLLQP
jgi:phage/plasmid-associated DNA primase